MLCSKTWPNWVGMPKEGLKELLKVMYEDYLQACSYYLAGLQFSYRSGLSGRARGLSKQ